MWVFNVLLYLMFLFSPEQYAAFKAAGAQCYIYRADMAEIGGPQAPDPPPLCWYDPSNVSVGSNSRRAGAGRARR